MTETASSDAAAGAFAGRRSDIEAIVAAARLRRGRAAGRMIRNFAGAWRLRLISVFAPMFGWQRHQLPEGSPHRRLPRSA